MLQDHAGRLVELHDEVQRRIRIHDVVVGELLAPELFRIGQRRLVHVEVGVEGGLLVGVLAVAHDLPALVLGRVGEGKLAFLDIQGLEIVRYGRVVTGREREGVAGELEVCPGAHRTSGSLHFLDDLPVVCRVRDHGDIGVIF